MARGPRRWIKVFCYETLHGSVSYQLSEAEQAVWVKLLCFAGLCGNEGLIADHDLRPYPHSFIVHEIHTTEESFEETLKKCKAEGRISEDGQGIKITNWSKYQSEYERQKKYRQAINPDKYTQGPLGKIAQQNTERKLKQSTNNRIGAVTLILDALKERRMTSKELVEYLEVSRGSIDMAVRRLRGQEKIIDTGGKNWGLVENLTI